MEKNTCADLRLIEIVTDADSHMTRAAFEILAFEDLQAIVTWYADGRPITLFMNKRNGMRLLRLLSVGSPINNRTVRQRQINIAKEMTILKLSQFGRTIKA